MLRVSAPLVPLLLFGLHDSVEAGGGGGGCGPVNETLAAQTGLFWMGDHLEWDAVAVMMGFVIVFTICCEQLVARARAWIKHFNPLLNPCLDKVIAELMILGAMAFSILLVNELTGYSLSNGSFMTEDWYHTLHWIDTTIFIFAIIYVMAACLMLTLSEVGSSKLGTLDETSREVLQDGLDSSEMEEISGSKFYLIKQLQYRLLKRHFLKTFFNDAFMKFDFVFYIELCHIGGMTSSFDIGLGEWLLLLVACIVVTRDAVGLKVYVIFTIVTLVLLVASIVAAFIVTRELREVLTENFDHIDDPDNLEQLSAAAGVKTVETNRDKGGSKTGEHSKNKLIGDEEAPGRERCFSTVSPSKNQGYFHHFLLNPHTPHNPHTRPETKKIFICGLGLTEKHLFKFVQRSLLLICFYLAVFVMNFVSLHSLPSWEPRHIPSLWFWISLSALLGNLFIVMPYLMFFGFSLAAVVNADSAALKEIGSLRQEGETALLYFQHMAATVYSEQEADLTQDQKIDAIFKSWAGSDDAITDQEIMKELTKFADEHDHMEFYMDRPKLLAMMRLVDDDRNGSLEKGEFRQFVIDCIAKEENKSNDPIPESLALAAAEIRVAFSGQSAEERRALETLANLLQDVASAVNAAEALNVTPAPHPHPHPPPQAN